jgi:hypothetical protein
MYPLGLFGSVVAVAFQSVFHAEMQQKDFFFIIF